MAAACRGRSVVAPFALILVAALSAVGGSPAQAQPAAKVPRVGVLSFTQLTPALQDAFRQGLREHGYVEGTNIAVTEPSSRCERPSSRPTR